MQRKRMKRVLAIAGATLALAAVAGPAAAAAPEHRTFSDHYVVGHACGITEATTLVGSEILFFEGGDWVRTIAHLEFAGVFTGPTGTSFRSTSRQTVVITPDTVSLSGQGFFLRGPGGVVVMDTGHLVFLADTGETVRGSAQAIPQGDAAAIAAAEAALCARLG